MSTYTKFRRAWEYLTGRGRIYRRLLNTDDGKLFLRDMAKFCRAHQSTAHADATVAARLDGRREVWLRIQHHLQLDDETLWRLYGGTPIPEPQKGAS